MSTFFHKIENSLPFMAAMFYAEYFKVWAKNVLSPQQRPGKKPLSKPSRIQIMRTTKI